MAERCRKCHNEVFFARMVKHDKLTGKTGIFDAEPSPKGNTTIGKVDGHPTAWVLTGKELETEREKGTPLYLSHFATCAFAKDFR
jgi:hypothetical protein